MSYKGLYRAIIKEVKSSEVVHTYNPDTPQGEAGGLYIQGQSGPSFKKLRFVDVYQ